MCGAVSIRAEQLFCSKKYRNALKLTEHPPTQVGKLSKCFDGNIGCNDKNSSFKRFLFFICFSSTFLVILLQILYLPVHCCRYHNEVDDDSRDHPCIKFDTIETRFYRPYE